MIFPKSPVIFHNRPFNLPFVALNKDFTASNISEKVQARQAFRLIYIVRIKDLENVTCHLHNASNITTSALKNIKSLSLSQSSALQGLNTAQIYHASWFSRCWIKIEVCSFKQKLLGYFTNNMLQSGVLTFVTLAVANNQKEIETSVNWIGFNSFLENHIQNLLSFPTKIIFLTLPIYKCI